MQALYAAPSRALAIAFAPELDVVRLFSLLGLAISIAVIRHLDVNALDAILAHIE
jgi:hypothetical protein